MRTEEEYEQIRQYAAGEIAWRTLRNDHGWERYGDVLDALGELGLRPPIVRLDGPNAAALARGTALLDMLLARVTDSE